MYAVVFSWYLVRVSVRSGVLGVGVVMHVLHLLDERYVVKALLGAARGYGGDGRDEYRLCQYRGGGDLVIDRVHTWL